MVMILRFVVCMTRSNGGPIEYVLKQERKYSGAIQLINGHVKFTADEKTCIYTYVYSGGPPHLPVKDGTQEAFICLNSSGRHFAYDKNKF